MPRLIRWTALILLLGGIMPAMAANLPDFDLLWNFDLPAQSEQKFRELLPQARDSKDKLYLAELMTQIARAQGLQGHFQAAHATLDEAEGLLNADMPVAMAQVRCLLERGRLYNSSDQPEKAGSRFLKAWTMARACGADNFAVDAAHMLAIVEKGDASLDWNLQALDLAQHSDNPKARKWQASLYNNIGWSYHDRKDYEKALDMFTRALHLREDNHQTSEIRPARWAVARCLRSLGRTEEALRMQRELLGMEKAPGQTDGFIHEEMAECLLVLGQKDEARPYFAKAYEELSHDAWLSQHEPQRIQRLAQLGEVRIRK